MTNTGRRREWDAATYDALPLPHEQWGHRLLATLDLRGDERVVDVGAGTGRDTAALLERLPDGQVVAIDGSTTMLDRLRDRLGAVGADRLTVLPSGRSSRSRRPQASATSRCPQDDSWSRTGSNNRSSKSRRPAAASGGRSRTGQATSQVLWYKRTAETGAGLGGRVTPRPARLAARRDHQRLDRADVQDSPDADRTCRRLRPDRRHPVRLAPPHLARLATTRHAHGQDRYRGSGWAARTGTAAHRGGADVAWCGPDLFEPS